MSKQKYAPSYLRLISHFHIDSFNFVIRKGLCAMCLDLDPVYTDTSIPIKISVSNAEMTQLELPMHLRKNKRVLYPSEARLRKYTYLGQLKLQLMFQMGDDVEYAERMFFVPIMLKSDLCHLSIMNEEELENVQEDSNDPGGYFIINGTERMMYLFLAPKRNYPIASAQDRWKTYKKNYSEYGISIRSVKQNYAESNNTVHYVNNSTYDVRFFYRKRWYCVPFMLLLKALVDETDFFIVERILKFMNDINFKQSLVQMLRTLHCEGIHCQSDAKNSIGQQFLKISQLPTVTPFSEVTNHILQTAILIHLRSNEEKFNLLCFCVSKLFCFVHQKCKSEDPNNILYEEILSPGQLYLIAVKEGINFFLKSVKNGILRKMKDNPDFKLSRVTVKSICNRATSFSEMVKSMIATGNIPARAHGFHSDTGYTVPLKRRNVLSLISQFTRVSKFSVPYCTKNARRYYGESWGFLCPAQTPEGEKCGLVNQLASGCQIVSLNAESVDWEAFYKMGISPLDDPLLCKNVDNIPVLVDGLIIGFIQHRIVDNFINHLNTLKVFCENKIPSYTEVFFLSKESSNSAYPTLCVYSSPGRMMRIAKSTHSKKLCLLGCLEQQFNELFLYEESNAHNFLGLSACLMPFGEYNPGVRTIFSCMKSSQGISVPFMNWNSRADTEASFLINYQTPLVDTSIAEIYDIYSYPFGTNVYLAIMSYTGFDMEDAIVLNKSSVERGLMRHITNRTVSFSFDDLAKELKCEVTNVTLSRDPTDQNLSHCLDRDGLPYSGMLIRRGDPILSAYSIETRTYIIKTYLGFSDVYVQAVKVMGTIPSKTLPKQENKVSITLTSTVVPETGDKLSNRHGQKGICSYLMPQDDLPFTEDGLVPDLIFNPHGMPSRMSIGMLFEMMASKSSSIKGSKFIFEPFHYCRQERNPELLQNLAELLQKNGFHYYGTEKFYSGTSGDELEADVFCGFVYYLRLHHLVDQKYQVRSIGPVEDSTQQPLYHSRSGAIRVGEMERDALLSHGSAELIADRLLHNSDKCSAFICFNCKQLLFPVLQHILQERNVSSLEQNNFCQMCKLHSTLKIDVPYTLIYLIAELSVLGIKINFSL